MDAPFTLTLAADQVTPVRAYAALRSYAPQQTSFLFESVVSGERSGRFSMIGYRTQSEGLYPPGGDALAMLEQELTAAAFPPSDPPRTEAESLAARLSRATVGFIGYDAAHPVHKIKPWENEGPMARLLQGCTVVVFDHLLQTLTIAGPSPGAVNRCAWELNHGPELRLLHAPDPGAAPEHVDPFTSDEAFALKVSRAREQVAAGAVSHVVLSRTFQTPQRNAEPFDVYRALRLLSPSPYLYFVDFVDTPMAPSLIIIGASPETMVRYQDGKMTLRSITGTRARGASPEADRALTRELLEDPRVRAEHVVRIDLARDDIGKVCEQSSVELSEEMGIARYSRSMHLSGEVSGKVREGVPPGAVLRAAFPSGALTGSPKARAVQLIRDLESGPRGVYGGAVGYFLPDGEFDLAIAHRAVVLQDGYFEVSAGTAITPGGELEVEAAVEETRGEARPALAAIRAAQDAADAREAADTAKRARDEAKAAAAKQEAEKMTAEGGAPEGPEGGAPEGPEGGAGAAGEGDAGSQ